MTVYYIVLLIATGLGGMAQALQKSAHEPARPGRGRQGVGNGQAAFLAFLAGSVLALVGALRWHVGTDYWTYESLFGEYAKEPVSAYSVWNEPGMRFLARLCALITADYALVFAAAAIITTVLAVRTMYRCSPYFALSLVLFVLTGPWMASFNAVRQYVACAIVFAGHRFILERRFIPYLLVVLAAGLFHVSAFALIFLYFLPRRRVSFTSAVVVFVTALLTTTAYGYLLDVVSVFRGESALSQSDYVTTGVTTLRILATLAPILFYMLVTRKSALTKDDHFYVYLLLLNAAVMVASMGSAYVARMAGYTGLFVCIALPRILRVERPLVRSLALLAIIPLYFAFWYIDTSKTPNLASFQWIFERSGSN